jgi:molybdopterin converting factor small subunit
MFPDASDDIRERSRACVADMIVGDQHQLAEAETVEFFPPLSGG